MSCRIDGRFNTGVDSWLSTPSGVIGGRVDGTLFRLRPDEMVIEELGRAIDPAPIELSPDEVRRLGGRACHGICGAERVTSLALLDGHRVIGTAGFPVMHLFLLEPGTARRVDLGPVNPDVEMCYFHDLAVSLGPDADRCVVLAETDSGRPDLYVLPVPESV